MRYTRKKIIPISSVDAIWNCWVATERQMSVPDKDKVKEHLEVVLQQLTKQQKTVFVKRTEEHMTFKEIAEVMSISPERTRQLYMRALTNATAYMRQIIAGAEMTIENVPIEALGLSRNKCECLREADISTVMELAKQKKEDLKKIQSVGEAMAIYLLGISRSYIEEYQKKHLTKL